MSRPTDQLYDPFIITYHGEYYGVATVKAVMDGIAFYEQKDIAAAREAQQAMNSPKKNNRGIYVDYDFVLEQHGEVGGDFIYAQGLQPHLSLFSIMDVCGKGLKASQTAMASEPTFVRFLNICAKLRKTLTTARSNFLPALRC